jgi:flagellar motor switch protein FliN
MSEDDNDNKEVPLPDLEGGGVPNVEDGGSIAPSGAESDAESDDQLTHGAADLEAVFDVPVQVSAVLGRSRMEVGDLLNLGPGAIIELDRKVGEAIDIYVNNRLVARGEVVLVEDKLGVTMTEIIKADRN